MKEINKLAVVIKQEDGKTVVLDALSDRDLSRCIKELEGTGARVIGNVGEKGSK